MHLNFDFVPDSQFDTYDSLIWKERYKEAGEFVMKTGDIQDTLTRLPLGNLVAIAESDEVMMVENHLIETDEEGKRILTVSGRTFETFFENRVARPIGEEALHLEFPEDTSQDWVIEGLTPAGVARRLIQASSTDSSAMTHHGQGIENYQCTVQSGLLAADASWTVSIKPGTVYERVLDFLSISNLGIRNKRPSDTTVLSPLTTEIYKGVDLSSSVIFSVPAGHFLKSSYLWSNVGYQNMVWAFSYYQWAAPTNAGGSGLNRRIGFLDASDIKSTTPYTRDASLLDKRGSTYLADHKKTTVFDGQVSPDIPYVFKVNYDLGDVVNVRGEYGVDQNVRVTEYIRIQDEEGERAYPSLAQL